MKVLVIAPSLRNTSPGSRFRIEQWMPYLEAAGVCCTYAAFEDERLHELIYTEGNYLRKAGAMIAALGRRISLMRSVQEFDLVFIYEEAARIGPAILERWIHWLGLPVVYDFCDPIYLPYRSPRNHHLARLKCFGKTASICRLADEVLVGNEALAEYAARFNRRVSVVPITIDTRRYRPKTTTRPAGEPPVIGWSGSHSTVAHLDGTRDVLREVAKQRSFRLQVIGSASYRLDGLEVESRPWSATTEVEDLHELDVGIMPLPDDSWTKLRSHLKVRQYMGIGLASVTSPVGVNREVVEDGVNGFLADSKEEWVRKLLCLIDDPELRLRLGGEARRTIENRYAADVWARRVLAIFDRAASEYRSSSRAAAS